MTATPEATHTEFTLERSYPNDPPARVFRAFTDAEARTRWFFQMDAWTILTLEAPDIVAPGAIESSRFTPPGSSAVLTNDTTWLEVIPGAWLVFAYVMTIDGGPLSSSLSTVRFLPDGSGTRLRFTEQGVYHAGYAEGRDKGTGWMLTRLGEELDRARA